MKNNYKLVDIEIEELEPFEDEYVYDLEMEDESSTFIANDILVHNTDSLFISFDHAINSCDWRDLIFNEKYLNSINKNTIILSDRDDLKFNNPKILKVIPKIEEETINGVLFEGLKQNLDLPFEQVLLDSKFIKDRTLSKMIKDGELKEIKWNWSDEIGFIYGIDLFRYEDFYLEKLKEHAATYGVENQEVFELEKISKSIINIAKKKYIMNIVEEDGIAYEDLSRIYPKGVELIRSSTPLFARDKIVDIVKYLFSNPDTFNIKELLVLVRELRAEFELADIDDISMQSSCSKYDEKIIDETKLPLQWVDGTHFAVKASAYHNYLLNKNPDLQSKYNFIKSGNKIKYYYVKDTHINDIFAFSRGSYPIEYAPEVDYDLQFSKAILSPINSIIEPLGLPLINQRLSVVMDIFSGFGKKKK